MKSFCLILKNGTIDELIDALKQAREQYGNIQVIVDCCVAEFVDVEKSCNSEEYFVEID